MIAWSACPRRDISLSQLQIEHLVFGQLASFHGKTKASHISIVLFARNKTIAVDADLHLAVNRFATIARAVFGNHVGYAMATFYQFVFKYLTPVSIRPNATPRISLEQHVDLFNQSMFHVGNSPGAQHADSPLNRWVIGFDEVLKDHELIDRLREENVHDILATVKANSQKTSRKQGSPSTTDATTANHTKRKGSTTSTAKSDTKKSKTNNQSSAKQATSSSSDPQECHFFASGRCRRKSKCPFLHNGRPANEEADSDEDNDSDRVVELSSNEK